MSKLLLAKGRVPIGSRFIHAKHHGCRYLRFDYRYAPNHKFLIFMKSYVIFYEVKNMALNGVFRQPPPPRSLDKVALPWTHRGLIPQTPSTVGD